MKEKKLCAVVLICVFAFTFLWTACEQNPISSDPTDPVDPEDPWATADAYRAEYADTLTLAASADALALTLSAADRVEYEAAELAARTAYRALSSYAKSVLAPEKTLLDTLKARLSVIEAEPYTVHSFDDIAAYIASPPAPYNNAGGSSSDLIRLILGPEIAFGNYESGDPDTLGGNASDGANLGMTRYTPLLSRLTKYVDLDLSQCTGLHASYGKTYKNTTLNIDDANKKYIVVLRLPSYVTGTVVSNKADGGSFAGYSNLKKAYLPGMTTIGKVAFSGCGNLEEIHAPKVSMFGEQFASSSKLKTMTWGKLPPSLESLAFNSLTSVSVVTVHVPYGTVVNDPTKGYYKWYMDRRGITIPFLITFVVDQEE
jgi:hypothetical protein